jgi:hypothetical protein
MQKDNKVANTTLYLILYELNVGFNGAYWSVVALVSIELSSLM